jgi:hypothetical protein
MSGTRARVWAKVGRPCERWAVATDFACSTAALLPNIDSELRQKLAQLVPCVVTCESRSVFLLREGRVEQSSILEHRACDVE